MIAPRKIVTKWLARAVRQQHGRVISEHRISDRGLHADARRTPSKNQVARTEPLERGVQICLVETAVSGLVDHDVGGLRLQFVNSFSAPGIPDQNPALRAVWRAHRRSHPNLPTTDPIWRIRCAHV